MRTIVFKINRLESALAMSKIPFLRKFEKLYTCKKNIFWLNKKIRVYLLLIKNRKKIISFKSATSTVNLWYVSSVHTSLTWGLIFNTLVIQGFSGIFF